MLNRSPRVAPFDPMRDIGVADHRRLDDPRRHGVGLDAPGRQQS